MNQCLQKQPSSPHLPLPDYVDSAAVLDEIRAGARLTYHPYHPYHPCHPYHPYHPYLPYRCAPHGCRRQPPKAGAGRRRYRRVGVGAIDAQLPRPDGGAPAQLREATPSRCEGGQGGQGGQGGSQLEPSRFLGGHARHNYWRATC